jgi:hypothetical protein
VNEQQEDKNPTLLCFFMLINRAWQWHLAWASKQLKALEKAAVQKLVLINCIKQNENS